jgi:hypothetical protein
MCHLKRIPVKGVFPPSTNNVMAAISENTTAVRGQHAVHDVLKELLFNNPPPVEQKNTNKPMPTLLLNL